MSSGCRAYASDQPRRRSREPSGHPCPAAGKPRLSGQELGLLCLEFLFAEHSGGFQISQLGQLINIARRPGSLLNVRLELLFLLRRRASDLSCMLPPRAIK